MKLIVGLGNPGSSYTQTRHNVGFMVLDQLAQRHGLTGLKTKFHSGVLDGKIAGHRSMLLQPTTFMNRSGLAVGEALSFYKLEAASDLIVVVDDAALPFGRLRIRAAGSSGGHNGLADIERVTGTQAYTRLRVGIDPPGLMRQRDYVLSRFNPDQLSALGDVMGAACDAIECWITDGTQTTMNRFNIDPHRDAQEDS